MENNNSTDYRDDDTKGNLSQNDRENNVVLNKDFLKAAQIYSIMYSIFQAEVCGGSGKAGTEDINVEKLYYHYCKCKEKYPDRYPLISKEDIENIVQCFLLSGVLSKRKNEMGEPRYVFAVIISVQKKGMEDQEVVYR